MVHGFEGCIETGGHGQPQYEDPKMPKSAARKTVRGKVNIRLHAQQIYKVIELY